MNEIKILKRLLKKKVKITNLLLTIFFITGNITCAIDITNNYINDGILNENINLIETTAKFTNNGLIQFSKFNNSVDGGEIINNGLILDTTFNLSKGIQNFSNKGTIFGKNNSIKGKNTANILNEGIIDATIDNNKNNTAIRINLEEISSSKLNSIMNNGFIYGIQGGISFSGSRNLRKTIGDINIFNNRGIISTFVNGNESFMQYIAVQLNLSKKTSNEISNIENVSNSGLISSIARKSGSTIGFYITGNNENTDAIFIEKILNSGVISGYSEDGRGTGLYLSNSSNYGYSVQNAIKTIINNGVIKGNEKGIFASSQLNISNNYLNNGILAGKIPSSGINFKNNGLKIFLDSNGLISKIENDNGGNIDGTEVINGIISGNDSFILSSQLNTNNNIILNGAGTLEGALVVDKNSVLSNSIINGYNTGLYLKDNTNFIGSNIIINGGGVDNNVIVIKGSDGANSLDLLGNSIINGNLELGDGDDILILSHTTQLNGKLDGGTGAQDTLNLGEAQITKAINLPNLNILHDIVGFENINTNGNITLFETVNITGAENITLESGKLVLRVDPTVVLDGKVTGHALYGNAGTLTSTGGKLVLGLNGLGEGTTISMGATTITPETNDSWWKDTDYIKTNSLVLDGKLSADGKDINITVLESLPLEPSIPVPPVNPEPPVDPPINPEPPVDPPINPEPPIVVDSLLYEKLNKVYQSVVSAGEIGNLANTTLLEDKTYNESLGGLLTILDQIYANNPYAYTLKSSRDSLKLFEDNMSYLTIKPKKDEVIVQGKAIYTGVKNDSSASGKNYYGFDTNHRNYKTTTNTVGGIATFEYGLSEETSIGFVFGGNNQDVKFKGSSKIKGNSLYLGTFAKIDVKNFKFMSGVGYQYTSADVDRKVSNRYDSFSTGDKYNINSLNAFIEAKYIYNAEQDWTVEPKIRLSYYYIDQDKVNEGYTPGQISMKTDKVNSNTADVEVGVDFVKSLYLNNGKLKNILSLGIINTIGDKSKELNGYILGKEKDGKKFDIQGVELPKTSGKVGYNFELEQINGMIYTAGVSLEFAKNYNRNMNITVGIGYKF